MPELKCSKGPWRWEKGFLVGADGEPITCRSPLMPQHDREEQRGNRLLIEHAWEMYQALLNHEPATEAIEAILKKLRRK